MRNTKFASIIIWIIILAGGLSSCSLVGVSGSEIPVETQIPVEPTGTINASPLFVPQTDVVINSVNASSLAPSEGVVYPGTSGFTWLPHNEGAALVDQDGVILLKAIQPGTGAQSATTDVTQTISSTVPSMLVASSEAERIAWVSEVNTINSLDVSSTTGNPSVIQTTSPVTGLALNSTGDKVAYGTFDGKTFVQPLGASSDVKTWEAPNWLSNLSFSPDGGQVAGADLANFMLFFMDANTGKIVNQLEWSGSVTPALYGVYLSPDWQEAAWVAQTAVQIMNVKDGSTGPLLLHQDSVKSVTWSPDGRLLATGAATQIGDRLEPAVMVWDASNGELLNTLAQEVAVQSVAFSPDGRQLAILDTNGNLKTWSISP